MIRLFLAGLVLALLSGCSSNEGKRAPDEGKASIQARVVPRMDSHRGEVKLPEHLRLPSVEYVEVARSWTDRLATMTLADRQKLEALNGRYYGMLEFDSSEEQRKRIAEGVPMPEEWLAAASLSDEDLARLAKAQSPKASMFYADRLLDRYLEARQRGGHDLDRDVINSQAEGMVYASQALAITRSPFAAYLYGSIAAQMYEEPEYIAASISVAGALGDDRAQDFAHRFIQHLELSHAPPLRFESIASIESMMWRHVHRYRPL